MRRTLRNSRRGSIAMHRVSSRVCPVCGSRRVVPIVFGIPDDALIALVEDGRAVLGGRDSGEDDPEWRCRHCAHDWRGMAETRARGRTN